jgi:2'-hydroxyisoflavone reductase
MHLLIIGGTRFLGKHIARTAAARGHALTFFNRGRNPIPEFSGHEHLVGDRDGGTSALDGRKFDAVVDTCGYVPRIVRHSAELLKANCPHYTFISTISVYGDLGETAPDESTPIAKIADEATEEITGETYGPLKALCEEQVRQAFPTGSLIIRPGLIVGPDDPTDRFTYWPVRLAQGGDVLVPADENAPAQFIDVRDLAEFTVSLIERKATGTYNATGPVSGPIPFHQFLQRTSVAVGGTCELIGAEDEFLEKHEVAPFTGLPLWLPRGAQGMNRSDISRAIAAGLSTRPLEVSARETLEWFSTQGREALRAGITREREAELLAIIRELPHR